MEEGQRTNFGNRKQFLAKLVGHSLRLSPLKTPPDPLADPRPGLLYVPLPEYGYALRTYRNPDDMWKEDPEFPRKDWQYEVANDDTLLGYWDWVYDQKAQKDAE